MALLLTPTLRTSQPQGAVRINPAFPKPFGVFLPSAMSIGNLATGGAGFGTFSRTVGATGVLALTLPPAPFSIAPDSSLVIPTGGSATIIIVVEGDSATTATNASVGDAGSTLWEFNCYLPYSGDGNAYFRWGGAVNGVTSVQGPAAANGVWLLSVGPAGMQIWRSGILVASNSATPTRAASSLLLQSGSTAGVTRPYNFSLFYSTANQFTNSENAALSLNPWQLFAPIPRRFIASSATVTVWRPGSDISVSGWTGYPNSTPNLFTDINEAVRDDTNYVTSPTLTSSSQTGTFGFDNTFGAGTYTLTFASEYIGTSGQMRVNLCDAGGVLTGGTGSWQTLLATLPGGGAEYTCSYTISSACDRFQIEVKL